MKCLSIIGLSIFLIVKSINAQQYIWTQKTSLPSSYRNYPSAFATDSFGYLGIGNSAGVMLKDFWKYDPHLNIWTQIADFAGAARFGAGSFAINGKGYVGMGWVTNTGNAVTDFYEYSPYINQWTLKANSSFPVYTMISFVIGTNGYIGTGYYPYTNIMKFYNVNTDTWTSNNPFFGTARQSAVGFSIGNHGYITTGSDGTSMMNDLWEYDPITDSWTQKSNFPGSSRYGAVGFVINNTGIVGTGGDGINFFTDFYSFNPANNQWDTVASLPFLGRRHGSGFSIGNKGYISCGLSAIGEMNDLWELSEVTSIAEATPLKPQVYFNQSAQVLHVSGLKNKPTTLTVTSMTGQIVLHQVCTKENMQLPLALAKGVYSYSLAGDEEQTSGKFEIVH